MNLHVWAGRIGLGDTSGHRYAARDRGHERKKVPIGTVARVHRVVAHPAEPLDGVIAAVVIVLAIGGAASLIPGVQVRVLAPSLDLVLDTVTTLVTLSVAALGWVRFRQRNEPVALVQCAAFLVLAIAGTAALGVVVAGLDRQAGMALAAPGQAPLYTFMLARLLAAALLVVGGIDALRNRHPRWPRLVVAGSALVIVLAIVLVETRQGTLPPLATMPAATGPVGASAAGTVLPVPTALGAALGILGSGLYLWAAGLSRRLYRRDRSIGDGYLAVGLVCAAFAQVASALYPGMYSGLVTSGNLLRLAFDVILLLGIQAEAGTTLARLRLANGELARLQVVEVERAALAERARLSRELHDGLAQNLWLAKLKAARLAAMPAIGTEAGVLAGELDAAIDAGLAEAREAVAAMRLAAEPVGTLRELLARSVDDFADRFGLRVEFTCDSDLPVLSTHAQAAALRIAQEALSNVRRHADATLVGVRVAVVGDRLVMTVSDNGCGFDPETVGEAAYGLASMRERAGLIGAELHIESAPQDGTQVSLRVPIEAAVTPVVRAAG